MTLSSKQKKQLKALAHHLNPTILVGKQGISKELIEETKNALLVHELVKVRFNEHKEDREELGRELAKACDSSIVAEMGMQIVLYSPHPEEESRKIELID